jgi:hypothetical protein
MEILMLVKTKNAGQFNALFENKDDFKEFLLTVLKHLQFAELQRAINNSSGAAFVDISKHYNLQFQRLEDALFYSDFDKFIVSDFCGENKFKVLKYSI